MTKANPINSHAALLLEYINKDSDLKKFLVISDLHIGSETELIKKGINIDTSQISKEILKEIKDLKNTYSFSSIIILGDLKSSITHITRNEWDTIPFFLKQLSIDMDEVFLIPGNHDANINLLVPDPIIVCNTSSGLVIEDTLLIHGHTIPKKTKFNIKKIIMGHVHPVFINPNSVVHGKRLWIYLKVKKEAIFGLQTTNGTSRSSSDIIELIIVPTFNKYFYSLRSLSYREYKSTISISPLIKQLIKNDGILSGLLFTLEGSLIGDIKEIENLFY
ncbi:MAG TPA: metallophosphoesterase [Nitrososphaeraceae archaeon]|nr:metallophosphoesterase [Nitrososphaeraceae archaeon]